MNRHMRRLVAANAGAHAGSLPYDVPRVPPVGGTASLPRVTAVAGGFTGAFFAAAVAAAAIIGAFFAVSAVVVATSGYAERAG